MNILYLPFLLQGCLMGIDEGLHYKRKLGPWERWGHPLDTLSVFLPLSYMAFYAYEERRLFFYLIMVIFSCLLITKDEFIHHEVCSPLEQWLHALLFILHPVLFFCGALLWEQGDKAFLRILVLFTGLFMTYQIIYWSIPWKKFLK